MSRLLPIGAINKVTGEYVYPKIANKKDQYACPECNKDLILCQGQIKVHHFRHKVDTINPCHYYSHPSESQKHKDAKLKIKYHLEKKTPMSFVRKCCICKKNEEFEIPEITETSSIKLEHRFEYKGGSKIADVAYIDDDELFCIIEICNTHKTCSENRPEPWFENDAETVIKMTSDINISSLKIPCIRCEKCEECENKYNTDKKKAIKKFKSWFKDFNDDYWCSLPPFDFREYDGILSEDDAIKGDVQFGAVSTTPSKDMFIFDKGHDRYYIYIGLEQPTISSENFKELDNYGIDAYYININWILKQKTKPTTINCVSLTEDFREAIWKKNEAIQREAIWKKNEAIQIFKSWFWMKDFCIYECDIYVADSIKSCSSNILCSNLQKYGLYPDLVMSDPDVIENIGNLENKDKYYVYFDHVENKHPKEVKKLVEDYDDNYVIRGVYINTDWILQQETIPNDICSIRVF